MSISSTFSFSNGVYKMLLLFKMSDSRYSNNTYEYITANRPVKYSELKIMEAKYSSNALSNTTEIKKTITDCCGRKG